MSSMATLAEAELFKHTIGVVVVLPALCLTAVTSAPVNSPQSYNARRLALIQEEQARMIGGSQWNLTAEEQEVDAILLKEKRQLIKAARRNGSDFPVVHNFLNVTAKAAMQSTTAFHIIHKMPKGGILHTHDEALTSIEWLVKNVTYRDHCYICVLPDYDVKFHFYDTPPTGNDTVPGCEWRLVSQLRAESADPQAFDQSLHDNISLITPDPEAAYPDINTVWQKFEGYFDKAEGLLLYAPVFKDYIRQGLWEMLQDNVQYVEIRSLLVPVYELDGSTHGAGWVLDAYRDVITSFAHSPDFTGGRIIKADLRFRPAAEITRSVEETVELYRNNADILVGYDLVAQEDILHPLIYYLEALLLPSRQHPPVHLPYFFHAGETNWQQTASDDNLVDAILLNATRIGHGFALIKHPQLLEMVRARDIAVEVSPISNQVLRLVSDLRNHPAAAFIAQGLPIVISSDDHAPWEALPLSHDFYVTFMALTGQDTGLKTLKQLAYNSLKYSSLSQAQKVEAIELWQRKWNTFITNILKELKAS